MSHQPKHIYEFGFYRLDAAECLLLRDGEVVPLQPKVFDPLRVLVEHHGHLLEKDELMNLVWSDTVVEEANLANNISILRKALGENGQQFIETVPKRGYRFIAEAREEVAKRDDIAPLKVGSGTVADEGAGKPDESERNPALPSSDSAGRLMARR